MKKCQFCGANAPNEANFCPICGGSDFLVQNAQTQSDASCDNSSQPIYNQNQNNQPNTVNQTWQPPTPQSQPKKKKTGLIIGIVAAALIVLAGIGIVAEKAFQNQGYGDNDTDYQEDYSFNIGDTDNSSDESSSNDETAKTAYTKGTFDGSVYTNEWADIKFALPNGFSNADADTYSSAENSTTECGAYFRADDTMSLIYIIYEKLPTFPVYDEEAYLDSAMKSLKSLTNITYHTPDTYSDAEIGGYSYVKAECELNNGYGDFTNTIYVRKLDNYIVLVSAIGINAESNDALVSNIKPVK